MQPSIVITTLNEQDSIEKLLDSLLFQTLKPSEVIIVDSASSDETISRIDKWKKQHKDFAVKIIKTEGVNRSVGRNLGVSKSKSEIVAVTDAGCVADKNWLREITKPMIEKKAEAVAGYYHPFVNTDLDQAIAPYVAVMSDNFDPKTFLPSSRSVAFTKKAWQKAGGYPEHLRWNEDIVFAKNLSEKTKMLATKKAFVYWHLAADLETYFNQIRKYAKGDVQAFYTPHLKKVLTVFLRYTIFLFLPFLFLPYITLFPLLKHSHYTKKLTSKLLLIAVQFTTDIAVITGSIQGIFNPVD